MYLPIVYSHVIVFYSKVRRSNSAHRFYIEQILLYSLIVVALNMFGLEFLAKRDVLYSEEIQDRLVCEVSTRIEANNLQDAGIVEKIMFFRGFHPL